jgi:hypothetical protein
MTGKRKDANHNSVVQALEAAGAVCIDCTVAPVLGFDLLILHRGKIYITEVKDGSKPASARKLTDGEAARKEQVELKNVPYNVVLNREEALRLIGVKKN